MKTVRIGILGPSEIAFRRFMPSIQKDHRFEYVGLAVANELEWFGNIVVERNLSILDTEYQKALKFKELYGGKVFSSYEEMLNSDIDAVYIPLPPALHFHWAKKALNSNKHVFVEKPSTDKFVLTNELIELARNKELALHENYMFIYHSQLEKIIDMMKSDSFGKVRLYRIAFGFPFRGKNDFRYHKALGGGALLDCGGYTIKLANLLLGKSAKIETANLVYEDEFDVDIFGSAVLSNDDGMVAQISFGMDNTYKNELEIWGNKSRIYTNRIFTAPDGYNPVVSIENTNGLENITLESDESFAKSINRFYDCINNKDVRLENYESLYKQSHLVEEFKNKAGVNI